MFKLRDYQEEARYSVNAEMNQHRNPVFVSPTGTGKTKTAVAIIEDRIRLNGRVYVLVPQIEIFNQWVKDLSEAGLNPGMIKDGKVIGLNRSVYVVMPLTLINMLTHIKPSMYPTDIITDECHHSEAVSWQAIYDFFPNAVRLGLTATPKRTDGIPLANTYDCIVSTITMRTAIEKGFLAKPLCVVPEEFACDVPIVGTDYDTKAQARSLGTPKIIGDVLDMYARAFVGRPCIVACCNFEHAKDMTEQFRAAGWNWEHLHSELPADKRNEIIRKTREGKLNGLCTVGIGIEGMDIPGLYGLIWLRRTLSITIYLQMVGRVLRPAADKPYGLIIDPVGNVFIHGFPEADRKWSLGEESGQAQEQIKVCPECGTVNSQNDTFCFACGALLEQEVQKVAKGTRKRKLPSVEDGHLVIIGEEGIEEVNGKINEMKEKAEQQRIAEAEEVKAKQTRIISNTEKVQLFRQGILSPVNRENFRDAVKILKGEV